jgi:hypothetical protein
VACVKHIPVIRVVRETLDSNDNAAGLGHDNGGLGTEFIFFMLFAFADTGHFGFVQAVNLVFVVSFLVDHSPVALKFFVSGRAICLRKLSSNITQQSVGHDFNPAAGGCHFFLFSLLLARVKLNDA